MADMIFNSFRKKMADGTIDLDSHTFYIMLLTDSYTPDATDAVLGDLSGEVANGNGYTTGGKALTGVTWNFSGAVATFDSDDVSWTAATFTARYAVVYDYTAATKDLMLLFDFGANKSPSNGTLSLTVNANGLFRMT